MLTIDLDKVCFVIMKMRELEEEDVINAQYENDDEGDALHLSEPSEDDTDLSSSKGYDEEEEGFDEEEAEEESASRDPYKEELSTFISNLSDDEQIELTALAWMGRGDFTRDDWEDGLDTARDRHNERTADYLMGIPLLPDYLAEGLAAFELSCDEFDEGRM